MRIISGKAKGMQLQSPSSGSLSIRPTSDRCREALFSILGTTVDGARVLDLYAGTGAFGLEALSRGAQSAVFVDSNPLSLKLIKKNIALLQIRLEGSGESPKVSLLKRDLRKGVNSVKKVDSEGTGAFDIIFLDPPYTMDLASITLEHLAAGTLLAPAGSIIAEERSKVTLPVEIGRLRLVDHRRYGDTCFWIYRQT
ncbi:MAG TPA: 16S rRNA (guanine(966)-N(2))-methyltransferase RsmD [Desulfopila sp.]|nr:16S rRNA (guanine(966)-N(2))-methyltransferase RsmD [Desulfopila sp.]